MTAVPARSIFERYIINGSRDLAGRSRTLLEHQRRVWPACDRGNAALGQAELRGLTVGGFEVNVQWNPQRIVSTAAKVDAAAIAQRPCFLCLANLPDEQQGILYREEYLVLCNPSPIFREHYTIAHVDHRPQSIDGLFATMLELTAEFGGECTVFYNGPKCGASAPDHLHLQAVPSGSMPVDRDVRTFDAMFPHAGGSDVDTWSIDGYGRTHCIFSSERPDRLATEAEGFVAKWRVVNGSPDEPLMNVVALRHAQRFHCIVFMRSKHRPAAFFAEGGDRIVVSPASVDIGGHIVTPREVDFRRLDAATVAGIFGEVSEKRERLLDILNG